MGSKYFGLLALSCALAGLCGACGAPETGGTVVIIDDRGRGEAQTTFGGIKLLTTGADLVTQCGKLGWQHNIGKDSATTAGGVAQTRAFVVPDAKHEVQRFELVFEDSALVSMTLEFRQPDPQRHMMVNRFARKKRLPDGGWAMTDGRRDVVVVVNRETTRLTAVHTGKLQDRAQANKMLQHFIGESSDARPAQAEQDPRTGSGQ